MSSASARQVPYGRLSAFEALLGRLSSASEFPFTVTVAPTERCNLRCQHCLVVPPTHERSLELEVWSAVLEELAALGTLFLKITGGEPALYPDLVSLVDKAVSLRFAVQVKSNGVLLSESLLDELMDVGLRFVDVSLYSDLPDRHDAFVGQTGAFDATVSAARRFRDRGGHLHVNFNLLPINQDRIRELCRFAESNGFTWSMDPAIMPRRDGDAGPLAHQVAGEARVRALRAPDVLDVVALDKARGGRPSPDARLCEAGRSVAYIDSQGDVHLCELLPQSIGNVMESSFQEIWEGSSYRKQFLALRWKDLPECGECPDAWACRRCAGVAYLETGDILAAAPSTCQHARDVVRAAARGPIVSDGFGGGGGGPEGSAQ